MRTPHQARKLAALAVALLFCSSATAALAQTPPAFELEQAVEVREGDVWSKATVVAKEGRRYQIKYEDGTLEWVTADRLRSAGARAPDRATARPKVVWQTNQKVEVKWGGLWSEATIVSRRGEWLLVQYERGKRKEWVEPWRLRKIGDTTEVPYAPPNPVVHKDEGPPREKPGEAPEATETAKRDDPFAPETFDFTITPADRTSAQVLKVPAGVTWSYKPAAGAAIQLSVEPRGPLHQGAPVSGLSAEGGKALIGYALSRGNEKGSSLEWIDLKTKQIVQLKIDKASRPIALMPGGDRLLAQAAGFFGGTKHRVDLWKLTPAGADHEMSFVPYANERGKPDDVDKVLAADASSIVTTCRRELTLWSLPQAKAVWRIETKEIPAVTLSPDRKSLAVADAGQVLLLDASSGRVQGVMSCPAGPISDIAFSPSGRRLFANAGGSVAVFDLEKGWFLTSLGVSRPVSRLIVLSDRLVDVGECVLNVDASTPVAKLSIGEVQPLGSSLLSLYEAPSRNFFATTLPIRDLEVLADTRPASGVIELKAGTPMSLDVSLETPQAADITQAMRASLVKGGLKVVEGASLRLVARTENGRSEERTYEEMGGPIFQRERLKISVTERITRLWIEKEGRKVWERTVSAMPGMIVDRKPGQSLPDAVAAANVPNVDWLRSVSLPAAIVDLQGATLPTKTLTPGGVK